MSNHQFIECLSSDPYIQSLGRQVSRLMNDPTLGANQRKQLVGRVQDKLLAYQARQTAKVQKKASQQAKPETAPRTDGTVAADPSGVKARRKEFRLIDDASKVPAVIAKTKQVVAANDNSTARWHRPLLMLKRA